MGGGLKRGKELTREREGVDIALTLFSMCLFWNTKFCSGTTKFRSRWSDHITTTSAREHLHHPILKYFSMLRILGSIPSLITRITLEIKSGNEIATWYLCLEYFTMRCTIYPLCKFLICVLRTKSIATSAGMYQTGYHFYVSWPTTAVKEAKGKKWFIFHSSDIFDTSLQVCEKKTNKSITSQIDLCCFIPKLKYISHLVSVFPPHLHRYSDTSKLRRLS